jgi:hypothetical protein
MSVASGGNHCKYSSVFINSKYRASGDMNDFVINFGSDTIRADPNTVIRVDIMEACINRSWWSTQEPVTFKVYHDGLIQRN